MLSGRVEKPILVMCFVFAVLCGSVFIPQSALAANGTITVAAASSLSTVLKEIAQRFKSVSGIGVRFSFASTGVLATQIEHGAPFDLFIAADKKYALRLEKKGKLLPGSVKNVALGSLVIVVNRASGLQIISMDDLRTVDARFAIGNPGHVPYGIKAAEALKSAGVWNRVSKRIVYGENVRQVLQFVQSGNAAVGIVAKSIAGVKEVYSVDIPQGLHSPIEYGAGIVTKSPNRKEAELFMSFFLSPEANAVLLANGFAALK